MPWESHSIENYRVYGVAHNTPGYASIYGFIRLYWSKKARATLWLYRDGTPNIPPNASFQYGDGTAHYYGRFGQAEFADFVDLLRNEKPVYFHWNTTSKGVMVSTTEEPVGEGEEDLP